MRNEPEAGASTWTGLRRMRQPASAPARPQALPQSIRDPGRLTASVLALGGLLCGLPVQAVEFGDGEFQGSLDTTISHGLTFRTEKRNSRLVEDDVNGNDGNLNYDRGVVSNTSKFTTDLDIGSGDFGAFVRASGFIDFENENGTRERTPLSEAAKDRVSRDLEVLDAYVTSTFDVGDAIVDARLGRHVLNWGESTFIPNGINAINPFDVSKLRLPGSELREALLPVGLASISVAPTDTLSVEGFYQLDWEETEIDAVGSYFSVTDYAGPGARKAVIPNVMEGLLPDNPLERDLGFGFGPLTQAINADLARYTVPNPLGGDPISLPQLPQREFDEDFANVRRGADRTPDDSGQWGLALRYFAEDLNNTEFGFYFMNYHSRLPTLGAQTSSRDAVQAGLAAASAVSGTNSVTVAAIAGQAQTRVRAEVGAAVVAGLIPQAQAPSIIQMKVAEEVGKAVVGITSALAIDRYADRDGKSGHYFLEYPEDIQLFGLSFNTVLGTSDWALQGEYSLRRDAPLQRAERKVIEDGLEPIIRGLGLAATNPAALGAYLAGYEPGRVQGYVERDVSQVQATATRVFGPTMGADGLIFLTEVALMHVHDMPDRIAEPLESPAGGTLATGDADADATSWGYRVAARLDYNNAIGSINLFPYTQFLHDVSGNSPAPSGPFADGRTALTIGLRADYLSRWQADLGYTRFAGDGNELSDRDFVSVSVKYSF